MVRREALLVFGDERLTGIDRQADAGGAEVVALEVEDAVVDEDGQGVGVRHVRIDVDLVVLLHAAHAVVPGVARLVGADPLEDALAGVVEAALLRNEEAAEGAVAAPHLHQVARHLADVPLAAQHPVAQEGVVRHGRGDQHRPHQVLLDLGIDVARGERQILLDDGVADGLLRDEIADQGDSEETGEQQQGQQRQQAAAVEYAWMSHGGILSQLRRRARALRRIRAAGPWRSPPRPGGRGWRPPRRRARRRAWIPSSSPRSTPADRPCRPSARPARRR